MMSQRTVCTLFIITALEVTFSYAGRTHFPPIDAPEHLANQPGCYSDLTQSILPYEKEVTPTAACVKLKCLRSKFTEITTCDLPLVGDGCHIQKNKGTFPACCDKAVCDKSKKTHKASKQNHKTSKQKPKASKQTPKLYEPVQKNNSPSIQTYYEPENNSGDDDDDNGNNNDANNDEQTNADTNEYNDFDNTADGIDNKDSDTYDSQQYNENEDETNTDPNIDTDYYYTEYDDLDYAENKFVYPYIHRPRQYYDDEYGIYSDINGYDDLTYSDVDYDKYGGNNKEYNEYEDDNFSNIENEYPLSYQSPLHYDDKYGIYSDPKRSGDYYDYPVFDNVDYKKYDAYKNAFNEYDKTPSNENRYPDTNDLQKIFGEEYEKFSNPNEIYPYSDDDIPYFFDIDDARVSDTGNDALTEQKYGDKNRRDGETNIDSKYGISTYVAPTNFGNFKQVDAGTKIEEGSQNHNNTTDTKVEYIVYTKQNKETDNEKYTGSTDDGKNGKDTNDKNGNTQKNELNYPESDKSKVGVIYYTQKNTEPNANPTLVAATGGNVDKTTIKVGSDSETTTTGDMKIDLEQAAAIDKVIKETAITGDKKIDLKQAAAIEEIFKDNTYIRMMETFLKTHDVSDGQAVAATQAAVATVAQNNIAKATASVGRNRASAFAIAG